MQLNGFYKNKLRSADKVTILYQLFILIIIALNFNMIEHGWLLALYNLTIAIFLLCLPEMRQHPVLNWFRVWNPVVLIVLNFFELHYLVHPVHPTDYDQTLIEIDYWLFGVHPTVWIEKLTFPPLTEYLQVVYSAFYFLPLILAFLLYRKNRVKEFDFSGLIITYGFYSSYIGYFLVPAIGPRFTLDHLQTAPLTGLYFTQIIRHSLDTLENIQRDCFPSGHTMLTVLTMYYAAKFHKKYFYVLLIVGGSLIFSTVYLRYHYVIDVAAGIAAAVLVIWTAPFVYRSLGWERWTLSLLLWKRIPKFMAAVFRNRK